MENSLRTLHETTVVSNALKNIDSAQLAHDLDLPDDTNLRIAVPALRIAAAACFADLFQGEGLDHWLRYMDETNVDFQKSALDVFGKWRGYIDGLKESEQNPTSDDLAYFAAAGLLARRSNEVRDLLRRNYARNWLDMAIAAAEKLSWTDRVRSAINSAILFTIRQENHQDIRSTGSVLNDLAATQRTLEAEWLNTQSDQRRDALCLLGFYHVAQSVLRTSEFLLAGSVITDGKTVTDFSAELRRLLVRAEEFLSASAEPEAILWLNAIGFSLIRLRESSIWVQARGISERIDQLIDELARVGRESPVFSLLPSQQDALRCALLDRARAAIILQMPTSAGKTLLAEFSIAQTFDAYRGRTRIVFVVPTRALATQTRRTLAEDLGPLGIKVSAAGSAFEEDPYELNLLQTTDGVVVATPEKLDLMLRAHPEWFSDLRLVVVDEAHLLRDSERGVRLELLLANIRREYPQARLLLLTPFMDNAKEIVFWLSQNRGLSITVQWRPSRILLGIATLSGRKPSRHFTVEWTDPYQRERAPNNLIIPIVDPSIELSSNSDRIVFLSNKFRKLGTILAMFSASPLEAEKAAVKVAAESTLAEETPQLRMAIVLARSEYGENSKLAYCLERGVAFHHSALSSILRYLVEDQVKSRKISFIAATATLAQGMNFPVAAVLVHSVHKPYGGGDFSSGEFWNMAGRAGRVGMVDKGLVIFANKEHRKHVERYSNELNQSLKSALLAIISQLSLEKPIKDQYRDFPELRPFIQYLAHAVATSPAAAAAINLEELLQQSLVNQQITNAADSVKLRALARSYLQQLTSTSKGFLKTADTTGLGSFSFDQLYAAMRGDSILSSGPGAILSNRENGIHRLIDVLRWLPELSLAIGRGPGKMDVESVAQVVQSWMDGQPVYKLADVFPGTDQDDRVRSAAKYVYGTVSQTVSWGAHAYMKGWLMGKAEGSASASDAMLPSYIQYGVHTPEAAVAALLGIPRQFAEPFAEIYRKKHGSLQPEHAGRFKDFVEAADSATWKSVVSNSSVPEISSDDARLVVRQMQGFAN